MQWVTKPVVNDQDFHLWAGDNEDAEVLEYTPGEWISINLRAKKYDLQYRGLLLYAIDAKDLPEGYPKHDRGDPTKIGKWEFNDRQVMFHSYCPRTVLHASGELKPYLTTWRFQPPADFSGEIQFVALIKTGPANVGEFWYPNSLVLKKSAKAPAKPQEKWYKGKIGESCAETCTKLEMKCDASRLTSVTSSSQLQTTVAPFLTCNKPPLLRCSDLGLSFGEDGFCYYSNEQKCQQYKLPAAAGAPTCDTKSDDVEVGGRLCPCACDGEKGPCFVPTTTTTTTTTQAPITAAPTQPGAPPCTGKAGGCCLSTGACSDANTECKLLGGQPTCVRSTVCVYGDAGCPCTLADNKCASGLTCQTSANSDFGVCAAATASQGSANDYCANRIGQAGCWCVPETNACLESNLVQQTNPEGKCYCAVNLAGSLNQNGMLDGVCERGELGCPCQLGRCKGDGVCKKIGANTLCLEDDSAASALAMSLAVLLATVAFLM